MAADFRRDVLVEWAEAPTGAVAVKPEDLKTPGVEVRQGLWPGIRKPPNVEGRGDETVSASVEPWVDANGYLAACMRALEPGKTPLIASKPESDERVVPYDSLELALIEARVCGGNAVVTPDRRFRDDWKAGKAEALAAWKRLLETAAWLREHEDLLGRPAIAGITMLVEPGDSDTIELANLLFRRNGSPDVRSVAAIPDPTPERIAVVCAGIANLPAAAASKLLAHARAGATVVTDNSKPDAFWRGAISGKPIRSQQDRDFYAVGKGAIAVYRESIADPSEFALDVIDVVGHPRRAVRLWNAPSVVMVASQGARAGQAIVHAVNYGDAIDQDVQTRVQGQYGRATLLAPGSKPVALKVFKRGSTTEVMIPSIRRLASVVFG